MEFENIALFFFSRQQTLPTCRRLSASLENLPVRIIAVFKTAGSVTGTMTVWTTAMRPPSCAVSVLLSHIFRYANNTTNIQ